MKKLKLRLPSHLTKREKNYILFRREFDQISIYYGDDDHDEIEASVTEECYNADGTK